MVKNMLTVLLFVFLSNYASAENCLDISAHYYCKNNGWAGYRNISQVNIAGTVAYSLSPALGYFGKLIVDNRSHPFTPTPSSYIYNASYVATCNKNGLDVNSVLDVKYEPENSKTLHETFTTQFYKSDARTLTIREIMSGAVYVETCVAM